MDFFLIQAILLVGASAISAYTDWKQGLILDKITIPLIILGIIINLIQLNWLGLALGGAVFTLLYGLYWLGKLGGGDVKLFTGIALVLPFYQNTVLLIPVLFFGALTAITFYSAYYLFRIWKQKINVNPKQNRDGMLKGALFLVFFTVYLALLSRINGISTLVAVLLWIPFVMASVFVALEKPIKENFFMEKVAIEKLGEDEVIALEFTDPKILEETGLGTKGIIGEKEKQKLAELGVKEVAIYSHAPKFGPFILFGIVLALFFPQIIRLFFLPI